MCDDECNIVDSSSAGKDELCCAGRRHAKIFIE